MSPKRKRLGPSSAKNKRKSVVTTIGSSTKCVIRLVLQLWSLARLCREALERFRK